jgi:hypothetical protein
MRDDIEKDASITRFPARMCLRAPQGLQEAIEAAARQRHTNPSEWARQALLGALAADGVQLLPDGRVEEVGHADGRRGA